MGGQGFALLTPLLWSGDVLQGRLVVPFPEKLSRRGWSYWLVFPPERRMVPKIKRFREWVLAEMSQSMRQAERIVAAIAAE
jgi:LysR family glycine cleavage system transcriptional activator